MQKPQAQQQAQEPPQPGREYRPARQSDFRQGGLPPAAGGRDAERGGSLREYGGVGFLLSHAAEFNLTDAQVSNLSKMRVSFELEKVDLLAALQKAKITFRALVRDPESDEPEVLAAIDRVAQCEADLRKMRFHHLKAARAQLEAVQVTGVIRRAAKLTAASSVDRVDNS